MPARRLSLIFDADDTLWDSNIHFLDAEAAFATALCEAGVPLDHQQVKEAVRRIELEVIVTHGYGRRPYAIALHRTLDQLAPAESQERLRAAVDHIGERLLTQRCELLPGVAETVAELATRHRLLLFSKGQPDEQTSKLEESGLAQLFDRVEIPREKDVAAYRRLIADAALAPRDTFMIGNSPRSDINPALRAGLGAVFIPYPHTWATELEEIDDQEGRLLTVGSFPRLLDVF